MFHRQYKILFSIEWDSDTRCKGASQRATQMAFCQTNIWSSCWQTILLYTAIIYIYYDKITTQKNACNKTIKDLQTCKITKSFLIAGRYIYVTERKGNIFGATILSNIDSRANSPSRQDQQE